MTKFTSTVTTSNRDPIFVAAVSLAIGMVLGSVLATTKILTVAGKHDTESSTTTTFTTTAINPWWWWPWNHPKRSNPNNLSPQAAAIDQHLQATQVPARALGIRVYGSEEENSDTMRLLSLTLEAPLERNTNVHQTAFAGSLFSVGVLTTSPLDHTKSSL
eukprot:scaffold12149_cov214-Amphora_coffeaeformis.AAC.2